jgi:hypothetical protein
MLKKMLEGAIKAGATSVDYKADKATLILWFRVEQKNLRQADIPPPAMILAQLGACKKPTELV